MRKEEVHHVILPSILLVFSAIRVNPSRKLDSSDDSSVKDTAREYDHDEAKRGINEVSETCRIISSNITYK